MQNPILSGQHMAPAIAQALGQTDQEAICSCGANLGMDDSHPFVLDVHRTRL